MAVPERMCVGCRKMFPKNKLIRFVRNPETKKPVCDERQKYLSRGIYVCKNRECISAAKKKKAFERFFCSGSCEDLYELSMTISRTEVGECE